MISIDTPNLNQLLGCYLHQDWPEEYSSSAAAIRAMLRESSIQSRQGAVREIDNLLKQNWNEAKLGKFLLHQAGCYFDPSDESTTRAEWLKKLQRQLDASSA